MRTRRTRRIALTGVLVALVLALSSCGVPIDATAHRISNRNVSVPQAVPVSPGGTATTLVLYFVRQKSLVAVHRSGYAYASIQTTADELLVNLDNGPLTKEHDLVTLTGSGLNCSYDSQTRYITVNLPNLFLQTLFGPSLYLAYGQIVLTLMKNSALSVVKGIQFATNGQLTYAYLPTETATQDPVTDANYSSLIAK